MAGTATELPRTSDSPARLPSLRWNFVWTFLGNFVHAFCGWGVIITIARFGDPVALGNYALGMAITTPAFAFAGLNLRSALIADVRQEYEFIEYLMCRSGAVIVAFAITAAAATLSVGGPQTVQVVFAVGVWQAVNSISDIYYGLLQKHERMKPIATSLALKGILGFLAFAIGMWLTRNVLAAVVCSTIIRASILFFFDMRSCRTYSQRLPLNVIFKSRQYLLRHQAALLLWCSPLAVHCVLQSLVENTPRYFIEAYSGTRSLGIFSAIAALISAGGTIVSALGQSAYPRLANLYAAGKSRSFDGLLTRMMLVAATLGGAGALAAMFDGKQILSLIYRPEYSHYATEFVWLMVAGGIGYVAQYPGYALTAAGQFKIQIPLIASVTLTAAGVSFFLVPRLGLKGAAIALALSAVVQLAGGLAGLKYSRARAATRVIACP